MSASTCSTSATGTELDRTGWVATSNTTPGSSDAPGNALDGDPNTRFSTDTGQAVGQYLELNLGEPQSFDQLEMLVPNSQNDYARGYNVEVSTDGTTWTTVASCTGTGTTEVASFPTQTAQYVEVVLTSADSSYWWSIDEIYLLGTESALSRTSWVASTNTSPGSGDAPANALDGNPNTRFSTDADQAVGQDFEVNMGTPETFNELQMDVPNSPTDYAPGYKVEVSNDGSTWTTVANGTGTGPDETIVFPTQTAQYVEVVLTSADSSYWWSIDEFNLYTTS
ncbi:MAG TPA: discoidin domain-containing protein [Acidimicrobiales bacterium]|nr:discoidin domain-containing protein [Acidimicrobiales bacterium]